MTKYLMKSDESQLRSYRADGRLRVWGKPHQLIDPAYQVDILQTSGGGVAGSGAFAWAALWYSSIPLSSSQAVNVVTDHLHPFVRIFFSD